MKYILSAKEMQDSDRFTIENGTKSIELMERAGFSIFNKIKSFIPKDANILVVCGSGGNGGDGYVIARYLLKANYHVTCLVLGHHFSDDCELNKNRFLGNKVSEIKSLDNFNCIIDAIFGVGLNKEVQGDYYKIIDSLNKTNAIKISVDVPSGLDATTGNVLGICFKCDYLYTIQNYKLGLFLNDGANYYDHVEAIDIGISSKDYSNFAKLYEISDFKQLFPKRKKVSNKGSYGKVALIGGSKLLMGALLLSANALAALRMGVGYSTICVPESLHSLYALKNLENTYKLIKDDDGQILFDQDFLNSILNYDVITIGMGIGTSKEVYKTIVYLLKNYKNTLIIDADGLNSLSKYGIEVLLDHECKVILTPHLKEFSRLSGYSMEELKSNLIDKVKDFARKYNLIINCKSNTSVISDGFSVNLNISGNPSLAKGGSGDVLSGITSGVVANNTHNTVLATCCGAYILGRCAELASLKINENSIISSDIINEISNVIFEIQNN